MALSELIVLNRKGAGDSSAGGRSSRPAAFPPACAKCAWRHCPRTCIRRRSNARQMDSSDYRGVDAYRFMLQLACGLESEIAGETEILGQIKDAWRDYEAAGSRGGGGVAPLDAAPAAGHEGNPQRVRGRPGQCHLRLTGAAAAGRGPAWPHPVAGRRPARRTQSCPISMRRSAGLEPPCRPRAGPARASARCAGPGAHQVARRLRWRRKSTHGAAHTMW